MTPNRQTGKGGPTQEQQLKLWRAYIDSERSNPQRLERADLNLRVKLAYRQALLCLRHFPEVCVCGCVYVVVYVLACTCGHGCTCKQRIVLQHAPNRLARHSAHPHPIAAVAGAQPLAG